MKFRFSCLTAGLLFALAGVAQAQTSCGTNDFELMSDTVAQGIMNSPAGYVGTITNGNLSPGTWDMSIDDTGWPTKTKDRRDYLKSLYVYDAGSGTLTLTLPVTQVGMMLQGPDQTFDGVATATFVVTDGNGNGQVDNNEFNGAQTLAVSIDASCAGTGTGLCGGMGAANGAADPNLITTPLTGALATDACATPVAKKPWSNVKALFQE